ncbi:hypothetical protein, partial [Mitsuokella jalaludinii]|uniref:hypothetical protein n=1 Tax=Mitsuokella jalaludinii TaxID=187979 RepID=UPI003C6DA7A6
MNGQYEESGASKAGKQRITRKGYQGIPRFYTFWEVFFMEAGRVYTFNPGPATLPLEVLKEAQ